MQNFFFWDGREQFLDSMSVMPIFNHIEMGIPSEDFLLKKLRANSMYSDLFLKAFGRSEIDLSGIQTGLAAFMRELAFSSQLNFTMKNANETLNESEKRGQELFNGKYNCNSCHSPQSPNGYPGPIFNDETDLIFSKPGTDTNGFNQLSPMKPFTPTQTFSENIINIGLDNNYSDIGFGALTKQSTDNGKFKVPSLRNVALTAPYMHDGRFKTLEEVIDFYSMGIKDHPNLDFRLKDPNTQSPIKFHIDHKDKKDLVAFLKTLTDKTIATDPRWANPFKSK
jgi:cytochrome c peroxidase